MPMTDFHQAGGKPTSINFLRHKLDTVPKSTVHELPGNTVTTVGQKLATVGTSDKCQKAEG